MPTNKSLYGFRLYIHIIERRYSIREIANFRSIVLQELKTLFSRYNIYIYIANKFSTGRIKLRKSYIIVLNIYSDKTNGNINILNK